MLLKKTISLFVVMVALYGNGIATKSIVNLSDAMTYQKTSGQIDSAFAGVPLALRASLSERLDQLSQSRRTHDWSKFVRLLSKATMRGRTPQAVAETYAKRPGAFATNYAFVKFSPKFTKRSQSDDDKWIISGCTKLAGLKFQVESFVVATLEHDEWMFSDFDTAIRDTGFIRCTSTHR